MIDLTSERQAAFARLGKLVERLVAEGRTTRSAGVKPALQFSDVGFDERRLGFRSFRAFLEEAERAGYVRLRRASEGPDVDVLPAAAVAERRTDQPQRIRGDLWSAFVDWRADWARVYDRETDTVGWLPAVAPADESGDAADLRRAATEQSERYVRIEPLDQQATLKWMREFVAGPEAGAARTALETALTSPRPIRAFVTTSQETGLHEAWNAQRLTRVRNVITEWAASHGLEVDLTREREPVGRPRPERRERLAYRSSRQAAVATTASLEQLRERVCRAVRRMSRGELLQLAIPLEYILDDADDD
jgi:Uncharacterised protein family (UPF0158)